MNRIDRLTAMLLYIQAGKRTAGELAQRFEVSRRTIFRDIQALCEMGIPIVTDLGATGGYTLPADYSLPPLALTLNEALLLRLALSSLSRLAQTPFAQERESLLAKVQTLLPRQASEQLDQLHDTVSLDIPARPYPAPFLDRLLQSAHEEQWISVAYRSENGVSRQTLLPLHLRTAAGLWYCEAYSYERQAMRVYRVDRFVDVRAAPAPALVDMQASRPPYVDPSFPEVHIHLTARGVLRLEREQYLASRIRPTENGEGQLSMRLRPGEYDWLVRILLGLGADASVLEPDELRIHLHRAAQEIAQLYELKVT